MKDQTTSTGSIAEHRSACSDGSDVSIVIPMKNEQGSVAALVGDILDRLTEAEVIVVDDGSTDSSAQLAAAAGAVVVQHPVSMGNGAAIKTGIRAASREFIVCMDADGQHQAKDIPALLAGFAQGYDLVVGQRDAAGQASLARRLANNFYNAVASFMVGQSVKDLTSGFRAFRASLVKGLLPLLPNGFSYPTTSLIAVYRMGHRVSFVPIEVLKRQGKSHISPLKDGLRFLVIIFRIATLYSPLKLFLPVSVCMAALGIANYLYTYFTDGRFTNMSVVMLVASVVVFVIGLVSEQVTTLLFIALSRHREDNSK